MQKRMEKRQENSHFNGWVYGQYVGAAIGAGFSKNSKYPSQPFYMMRDEFDDEEAYVMTDADRFSMFAMSFNASHRDLKPAVIDMEDIKIETDRESQ